LVIVLADAARWGGDPARVAAPLPAARRAVEWCHRYGDVDGDGFVTGLRLGANEVTIEVDGKGVKVEGADDLIVEVLSDADASGLHHDRDA
jgi:hypothetical protein